MKQTAAGVPTRLVVVHDDRCELCPDVFVTCLWALADCRSANDARRPV